MAPRSQRRLACWKKTKRERQFSRNTKQRARIWSAMSEPIPTHGDPHTDAFLKYLETERGASVYTLRNYSQALQEFARWHESERKSPPPWGTLARDDFRA